MKWQNPKVETISEQDLLRQVAAHAADEYVSEKSELEEEGEIEEKIVD